MVKIRKAAIALALSAASLLLPVSQLAPTAQAAGGKPRGSSSTLTVSYTYDTSAGTFTMTVNDPNGLPENEAIFQSCTVKVNRVTFYPVISPDPATIPTVPSTCTAMGLVSNPNTVSASGSISQPAYVDTSGVAHPYVSGSVSISCRGLPCSGNIAVKLISG